MSILHRPVDAVLADVIPFYWEGKYHLFYLHDTRRGDDPDGHGIPWRHLATCDFLAFEDWGVALPRGGRADEDLYVFTGCVVEHRGTFHIFYTGHNPHLAAAGRPQQVVLHATSPDLRSWVKDRSFRLVAPLEQGYERDDWRDPFVWFDERCNRWSMLLAARRGTAAPRNRGCIALATSPDLAAWTVREPFWDPQRWSTHECPDLFRMGGWWYLLFSEFSDNCVTRYRMARDPGGPWLAPGDDVLDDQFLYAAKTAGDGRRRFAFGWMPTRDGERDSGARQWGGDLVVHEVVQRPDGTLAARMPETVASAFTRPHALIPRTLLGTWDGLATDATGRHALLLLGALPDECLIDATLVVGPGVSEAGVVVRSDAVGEASYRVRLEPARNRLVWDRWPRPSDCPSPFARPLAPIAGRAVALRILVSGSAVVVYADGEVALSQRMYDRRDGQLGLYAADGALQCSSLAVRTR